MCQKLTAQSSLFDVFSKQTFLDLHFCIFQIIYIDTLSVEIHDQSGMFYCGLVTAGYGLFDDTPILFPGKLLKSNRQFREEFLGQPIQKSDIECQGGGFGC